jgi:hypothetical protein
LNLLQKTDPSADLTVFSLDQSQAGEILLDSTADVDEAEVNEEDEALEEAMEEISINEQGSEISADGVKRLLAAVSYGYGMFQIFISFMPPAYLKVFKMFGK